MYGLFVLWIPPEREIPEEKLMKLCQQERALFVQIESYSLEEKRFSQKWKYFSPGWYKKFITPYTVTLDLTQDQNTLFKSFHKKCQYHIRLAERKWVRVEKVKKTKENIEIFFDLVQKTTLRNGFHGNSHTYYTTFLETIPESELFFVFFEEKVICAAIFVSCADTYIYYYGASDRAYASVMWPYALQWYSITHAMQQWRTRYDFMGIATPGDSKSTLLWVTQFKKRFSEKEICCSQSMIWIRNRLLYFIISQLRKLKK